MSCIIFISDDAHCIVRRCLIKTNDSFTQINIIAPWNVSNSRVNKSWLTHLYRKQQNKLPSSISSRVYSCDHIIYFPSMILLEKIKQIFYFVYFTSDLQDTPWLTEVEGHGLTFTRPVTFHSQATSDWSL